MKRADQRRIRLMICSAAVTMVMAAIFAFSHQPGGESEKLSKTFLDGAKTVGLDVFTPEITFGGKEKSDGFAFKLEGRKWAHLYLFALLGVTSLLWWEQLLRLNDRWLTGRKARLRSPLAAALAFAFCLLYACTDELHQLLIDDRHGRLSDVLYDALGFGLSILLTLIMIKLALLIRRRIQR